MNMLRVPADELTNLASSPEEISRFVVEAAVHAPSLHNSQPWWFSTSNREISLHADLERRLHVADPRGREMMIGCGAALFTARLALRYLGLVPKVSMLPDPDLPNLVARIRYGTDQVAPVDYERELFAEITRRHTHRGGFDPEPMPASVITVMRAEASRENATLAIMTDEAQREVLAAAVETAERAVHLDAARMREQARWSLPPGSSRRDGVPVTAYPARPEKTQPSFPARDFAHGRGWGLPPSGTAAVIRSAGLVTVLTTRYDRPEDWVNAGQALQRVLLAATSCGLTAALHSQPLEVNELRSFISTVLCGGAYPQMVIRLGSTGQTSASVRRSVEEVLL
ncbi:MAG: nitroreductase family protein [Nocardiopsaceae bacterium]|jgi:nitroreductase|nr:nitroreductase family protein [Nocardiopsaceae bacterium]